MFNHSVAKKVKKEIRENFFITGFMTDFSENILKYSLRALKVTKSRK